MILELFCGNCLDALAIMPDNSIDSVVTDPPYGLKFMGKKWDYEVPSVEIWKEVLRVLKPGGHVLSFCGTRTYHRMVVNMEDAGLEIRDQLQWIYGSGFPKSTDVSKRIDKEAGAEGPIIGKNPAFRAKQLEHDTDWETAMRPEFKRGAATDSAKQWQGWGTALKPANEPICLARKPIEGTVAQNVLKYGVGGLNIDATRIGSETRTYSINGAIKGGNFGNKATQPASERDTVTAQGRFPANVLFDESAAEILGEPSRFFYVAKASKSERNAGMGDVVKQKQGARPKSADASGKFPDHDHRETGGNNHPTVKPLKLMQYLIKLITPPGGVCLDPFMGSGTTGVAAKSLGFDFIGCELNKEYLEIAKRRIENGKN